MADSMKEFSREKIIIAARELQRENTRLRAREARLAEALQAAQERFERMAYACTLPKSDFEKATRQVADEGASLARAALEDKDDAHES